MKTRDLSGKQRDAIAARGRRCERAMREAAEAKSQGLLAKAEVKRLAAELEASMALWEAAA